MKLKTSFDYGDELVSDDEIKVTFSGEIALKDIWQLPDMRQVIADSIEPQLRQLNMSEKSIKKWKERIVLSGELMQEVKYPYWYDFPNHRILNCNDKKVSYSVHDWIEGNLPETIPVEARASAISGIEVKLIRKRAKRARWLGWMALGVSLSALILSILLFFD